MGPDARQVRVRRIRAGARFSLAALMVAAGTLHFINPGPFVKIVPTWLPHPQALVYVSGFFEVVGGVGLLIRPLRRAAAWGLIALFVAVFPANVNMAVNDIALEGLPHNRLIYWWRLPLQGVLIGWAWWLTGDRGSTQEGTVDAGHDVL